MLMQRLCEVRYLSALARSHHKNNVAKKAKTSENFAESQTRCNDGTERRLQYVPSKEAMRIEQVIMFPCPTFQG